MLVPTHQILDTQKKDFGNYVVSYVQLLTLNVKKIRDKNEF